jgi:hypothetical protein
LADRQLKAVFDAHHYVSSNIYNMDEVGFTLSSSRRTRRVGSHNASRKSQSTLGDTIHITVVAAISTGDAPVPPFLIYKGENLLDEWVSLQDQEPPLMATTTASGYANSFTHLQWLTTCFDPSTRDRAAGASRLLFLDGPNMHTQVDFLEACWSRDIIPIILPANLSGIFQPLDVNFFNTLKLAYHHQVDDFQLGSSVPSVPKGMFYQWFQRAWATTAYPRQIRSAWAKAGLWPLDKLAMRAGTATPPPIGPLDEQSTPQSSRMLRTMERQVKSGSLDPAKAFQKTAKALETMMAEKVLLELELERHKASEAMERAARGRGKLTRFPKGHVYSQRYHEEHAVELAARKAKEKEARDRRSLDAYASRKGKGRALQDITFINSSMDVVEE